MDAAIYRGMSRAALDAAYNNRAAVRDYPAIAAARAERSERVRGARRFRADLRYGEAPRERLDFFPAVRAGAPVLAFFHGGYWQSNDKEASSFLVEGPLERGFAVALVEYTLAPEADMDRIVAEAGRALDWLARRAGDHGADPGRLFVAGHSAGGHLAATALGRADVAGVLAISGLFDLEPIRLCYLDEKLRLTEEQVRRHSPLRGIPGKRAPAAIAAGARELPELVRQSSDYAAALGVAPLLLPAHDHFSILEELARPQGALCEALLGLAAGAAA